MYCKYNTARLSECFLRYSAGSDSIVPKIKFENILGDHRILVLRLLEEKGGDSMNEIADLWSNQILELYREFVKIIQLAREFSREDTQRQRDDDTTIYTFYYHDYYK